MISGIPLVLDLRTRKMWDLNVYVVFAAPTGVHDHIWCQGGYVAAFLGVMRGPDFGTGSYQAANN